MSQGFAKPKRQPGKQRQFYIELNHRSGEDEFLLEVVAIGVPRQGNSAAEQKELMVWLLCYLLGDPDAYAHCPQAIALEGTIERKQFSSRDAATAIRRGLKPANLRPNQAFIFNAQWQCLRRVELQPFEGCDSKDVGYPPPRTDTATIYFQQVYDRPKPPID